MRFASGSRTYSEVIGPRAPVRRTGPLSTGTPCVRRCSSTASSGPGTTTQTSPEPGTRRLATGAGDRVVLLGTSASWGSGDVVVALDVPYGLGRSAATSARLALFGRTPQAFDALVDVLTGRAQASGTLPVTLQDVTAASC